MRATLKEWLAVNDRGSFAMGTPSRLPERKYHGLLLARRDGLQAPLHVLAEVAETIRAGDEEWELARLRYADGTVFPNGEQLVSFEAEPTPAWTYRCGPMTIVRTLHLLDGADRVRLEYSIEGAPAGAEIQLRPVFTARDAHDLARETPAPPELEGVRVTTDPPASFDRRGHWINGIRYDEEAHRGYPSQEDAWVPGSYRISLDDVAALSIEIGFDGEGAVRPRKAARSLRERLERAARAFVVDGPSGPGVIAGYPWFGEWGRDTMISLDDLAVRRGRTGDAAAILDRYAAARIDGLIPNLVGADAASSDGPSPDASLWFVRAVAQLQEASGAAAAECFHPVVEEILDALAEGRAAGIHLSDCGNLAADRRPRALTWMDALIDGEAVTPRAPFAVDLGALWYDGLRFAEECARDRGDAGAKRKWRALADDARRGFRERFWLEDEGYAADSHDGTTVDASLRPNQLLALALPHRPLTKRMGIRALRRVQEELVTPFGLRTLAPGDPAYLGRCEGDPETRDRAYHQGTIWPWWIGPYLDAVAIHHDAPRAAREARFFLDAFERHLDAACAGHVSEIFDGDEPHEPRGAPAQAWSTAALLHALDVIDGA